MRDDEPNLDIRYDECADLIHAAEGSHTSVGVMVARWLERYMRLQAFASGRKSKEQALGGCAGNPAPQPLCPGCYTLILINALLELARSQNQDVRERCLYMAREFTRLAEEAREGRELVAVEGDKL